MSEAPLPEGRASRPFLGTLRGRERAVAYLCISPWVVGFVAFTLGPMLLSLVISFTDYDILNPASTHWVGVDNYRAAAADRTLAHSVLATLYYAALVIPGDLVLGLLLALALNVRLRGISIFRTIFFLPVMISGTGGASVAVALLWLWIFQPRFGLLNFMLSLVHLPPQLWIYSERLAVPSLALMGIWTVARSMIVYLAALQGLPAQVLWAAELDGASIWRRFLRISLPLISPAILFNLVLDLVGALQTFTQAYLVTAGGPGDATLFYMLYLFRNSFSYLRMGYASALAWLLFGFTLLLTLAVFRSARRWVYYEGAQPR